MFDMNKGYHGYSMSNRAVEAYEDGEMPESKWTKGALLSAIAYEFDKETAKKFEKFPQWFLFKRLTICSSWHHTSKFCNVTYFYELDTDFVEWALEDFEGFTEDYKKDKAERKLAKSLKNAK